MKPDGYKLNALEQEYVVRSRQFKLRILYSILAIIGTIILVILSASIYSNYQRELAVIQRDRADSLRIVADSNAAKFDRERIVAIQARDSMNLARIEADTARAQEERQRIRAENEAENARLSELEARRQERLAKIQAEIAERRRIYAEIKEREADSARGVAEAKTREAYGYLMRQTARAMSIKSLQIEDPELRTTLTLQAWLFHKNFSGAPYDTDIYNGLYQTLILKEGHKLSRYEGIIGGVRELKTHPQKGWLISGGEAGTIDQWDPDSRTQKTLGSIEQAMINSIDISPDGKYMAFASFSHLSREPTLKLMQITDEGLVPVELPQTTGQTVWDVHFSPDSKALLFCGADKNLSQIKLTPNLTTATIEPLLQTDIDLVELAMSHDEKYIAALDEHKQLLFMDQQSFDPISIPLNSPPYFSIAFSPDSNWLAIGTLKDVILFNPANGESSRLLGYEDAVEIRTLSFSPDGKLLATGASNGDIALWSLDSLSMGEVNKQLPVQLYDEIGNSWVLSLSFSPDSKTLYAGYNDVNDPDGPGQLKSWPVELDVLAERLKPHISRPLSQDEWNVYVGESEKIEYQSTPDSLRIY